MRISTAWLLAAVAPAIALQAQRPEETRDLVGSFASTRAPEEARNDEITCDLRSLRAEAEWLMDQKGEWKELKTLQALMEVNGELGRIATVQFAITQALDESGKNLIVEQPRLAMGPSYVSALESSVRLLLEMPMREWPPLTTSVVLSALPPRFERVTGHVECLMGDFVMKPVEPNVMAEAIEIVPGVTFRWTQVQEGVGGASYSYEARVQRERGERAGLEPVFAGIQLEDGQGKVVLHSQPFEHQRAETAEQYVYCGAVSVTTATLERVKTWQVRAFNDLRRKRIEFEARSLTVAEGEEAETKHPGTDKSE